MIGRALGWKYNHAEGICTKASQITTWPEDLGPQPTEEELVVLAPE